MRYHRVVKTPLVLVPGLLCDEAVWAHQSDALADIADIQIATNGARDSLIAMAEAITAQAPPRFAVAGHSMGGRVALEVVRRVPERVIALALLDTGYQALAAGEAGEREVAGRHALVEKARRQGMRAMGWEWLQGMVYPSRLRSRLAERGRILASVPDLISVLDSETADAIPTERIRYGQRVVVIAFPCDPVWRTARGIEIAGPRAFGYEFDYVPVEERAGARA